MKTIYQSTLLTGLLALFFCVSLTAQTQLGAGDIAFTGFHSDGPDDFSFFTFTDINAATTIRFTDNGWKAAGGFRLEEGILEATFTADVPCGTEVYAYTGPGPKTLQVNGNEVGTIIILEFNYGLSVTGDQLLAYQGTEATPVFLAAVDFNGTLGWDGDATSNSTSAIPAGLSEGGTAVGLTDLDNSAYVCVTITGTKTEVRRALNTAANWKGSNIREEIPVPSGCSFNITDCVPPPVARCKNISVTLDKNGNYFLSPKEVDNGSSAAAGIAGMTVSPNKFDCSDIGRNKVVLTVTDQNGLSSTCTAAVTVVFDPTGTIEAYTILAAEEVHLHGNQTVLNGGVGAFNSGEVKAHENTKITAPTTFVRAKKIEVKDGSKVAKKIYANPEVSLPPFMFNPYDSDNDVKVEKYETVTLKEKRYGKVELEEGATVIFTQKDLYLKELKVDDMGTVRFSGCSIIRLRKQLEVKEDARINPDRYSVSFFVEDNVKVKEGASVWANIDARYDDLKAEGKEDKRISMTGRFIGKKVEGKDGVDWNWNPECGSGCAPASSANMLANAEVSSLENTPAPAISSASSRERAIKLYPNPVRDEMFLNLEGYLEQDLIISVYNQFGQQILRIPVDKLQDPILRINLANRQLPSGTYFLSLRSKDEIQTKQFIITN